MGRRDLIQQNLSPARREVLVALKKLGEASAAELAEALNISASAVRQHLGALRSAEYVATRRARGKPGRPADLYHSTEHGDALFAPSSSDFSVELLGDLEVEDPELIGKLFRRREERRADAFRAELGDLELPERLVKLTELLDREGYLTQWANSGEDSYMLSFNNCAIWGVAERYALACSTELSFLRRVFNDAEVTRLGHRRAGNFNCGYEIRPMPLAEDEVSVSDGRTSR